MMDPEEITVVVHGARGLQGRKPGRHKFSVIFGIGTKKYRTSVVKELNGNPDWNEESVIPVTSSGDHVFLTVTEKDDLLGQLVLPISSLLTVKGIVKKSPLKAHKKCLNPQGDLIFQCYISKQRPQMIIGSNTLGFQKLRQNFVPSQNAQQKKEDKDDKKRNSLANFNRKISRSLHDIFSIGLFGDNKSDSENDNDLVSKKEKRFSLQFPSLGSGLDKLGQDSPVVTHIVPNMASVHGSTRLAIEGRNLGIGKSDIMEFTLCGTDLLDSIEFESETRIYVVTKPSVAGKGDLCIETISGGQNTIKNVFTFVERAASIKNLAEESSDVPSYSGRRNSVFENFTKPEMIRENGSNQNEEDSSQTPSTNTKEERHRRRVSLPGLATILAGDQESGAEDGGSMPGRYRKNIRHLRRASESVVIENKEEEERKHTEKSDLQTEILRLHKENEVLKRENADMKLYIDGLVARVMIHCPEALAAGDESKPSPSDEHCDLAL